MNQRILYRAAFALAFAYWLGVILMHTRLRFVIVCGVSAGLLASVGYMYLQAWWHG